MLPPETQKASLHRAQFDLRLDLRLLELLVARLAVVEESLRPGDATHVEARELAYVERFAHDHLGASAADVDDEASTVDEGRVMRHAEIDESRLLGAAHDLDRVSERGFGGAMESALVRQLAHRARADRAYGLAGHEPQSLPEALQALERALRDFLVEVAALAESFGESDALAEAIEQMELGVEILRHHHVEAVRPEVDGGNGLDRLARHVLWILVPARPRSTKKTTRNDAVQRIHDQGPFNPAASEIARRRFTTSGVRSRVASAPGTSLASVLARTRKTDSIGRFVG